ncbi:hypothetical protein OF001_U30021 [Pseudomonas sp. OF001]|nr:hypothetical protein OF001_U30021 [Pseudomonas sp. OF001]
MRAAHARGRRRQRHQHHLRRGALRPAPVQRLRHRQGSTDPDDPSAGPGLRPSGAGQRHRPRADPHRCPAAGDARRDAHRDGDRHPAGQPRRGRGHRLRRPVPGQPGVALGDRQDPRGRRRRREQRLAGLKDAVGANSFAHMPRQGE